MSETDILDKYVKKRKEIVYEQNRKKFFEGTKLEKSEKKIAKLEE